MLPGLREYSRGVLMKPTGNSHKAFISFDALFSILPVIFMVSFIIQTMAIASYDAAYSMEKRQEFNFLVATADYVVKAGAAEQGSTAEYVIPNWIDESMLDSIESEISDPHNLGREIVITTEEYNIPEDVTCIYRLIVAGGSKSEDGEIKKLYVCG